MDALRRINGELERDIRASIKFADEQKLKMILADADDVGGRVGAAGLVAPARALVLISKELPADDSGYGFDNIGDVLAVSPLLMEKYMAAAKQVSTVDGVTIYDLTSRSV